MKHTLIWVFSITFTSVFFTVLVKHSYSMSASVAVGLLAGTTICIPIVVIYGAYKIIKNTLQKK